MPYASLEDRRKVAREGMRKRRERARAARKRVSEATWPPDPAEAVIKWAATSLVTPAGHPRAGQPLALPEYLAAVVRDIYRPGIREICLIIARKNAKSAAIAVVLLAHLAGPLKKPGFRAGVASISKEKAAELKKQMQAIAEASGLVGLRFLRSPAPGRVESDYGAVDILSSDSTSGAAAGFDLAVFDELGLTVPRDRELVNSLRSSVSARNGRFLSLSVRGTSPFIPEILERRGDPALAIHEYVAPDDCAIDDPAAWAAANPGIACGIKQASYMADEARRVAVTTSDEGSFRAFDLNQAVEPTKEMVCTVSDLTACFVDDLPDELGPCFVAFDIGESKSGTSACAYWPTSGAVRTWLSFGDKPSLIERGKRDGADYVAMERRGELRTYPGRVVPVAAFVSDVRADLAGANVRAAVADAHKLGELRDCLPWPLTVVRSGAGPDGSQAVRSFQRAVLTKTLKLKSNLSLASAIKESTLTRGRTGMPTIDRERSRGRIDVLSAAVLAVGEGAKYRPAKPLRFLVAR